MSVDRSRELQNRAERAMAMAYSMDGIVAALTDVTVARNAAGSNPVNLPRAEHRPSISIRSKML